MSGDFLDGIWVLKTDTGDYNKNIIVMDWRGETRENFGAAIFYCTDNVLLHGPTAPNIMKYLGAVDDSGTIQHKDFPRIGDKIMGIFLSDEIFNKNPRKYTSQKVKEIAPSDSYLEDSIKFDEVYETIEVVKRCYEDYKDRHKKKK